ncbi:MAG: ATP-binding cassette domain-containing protein [Candidatus Zambryskibacteria bacterium]
MSDIIDVKNLTVKFGDFTAVNNVSFNVAKGEIFAFLGPNGAGKTTTIKVLTTLLQKTDGEVLIAGASIGHDEKAIRKTFGIVFQDQSLDDELTAYENMEFHGVLYGVPKEERRKKIDELFSLVDLADRKKDLVRNYSGGMKRRLEIARALIHEPKILYLDEPTLGLDPQTRNHIWEYIRRLNKDKGMTIFFTTHYMDEAAKNAGKVAIIDHGKIIISGTPQSLMQTTGTSNLEDAFIKLTGQNIRDEGAGALDALRQGAKAWGRR